MDPMGRFQSYGSVIQHEILIWCLQCLTFSGLLVAETKVVSRWGSLALGPKLNSLGRDLPLPASYVLVVHVFRYDPQINVFPSCGDPAKTKPTTISNHEPRYEAGMNPTNIHFQPCLIHQLLMALNLLIIYDRKKSPFVRLSNTCKIAGYVKLWSKSTPSNSETSALWQS